MPTIVSSAARLLAALLTVLSAQALAQPAPTVRIRGAIEAVDGALLTVKTREGQDVKVRLTDNVTITGVAKIAKSDIKTASYIGVTGMPQPDGSQKAVAIHVFQEAMRGTGEGFRPWDQRPNSTMTNATVDQKVEANDGDTIVVKYKDGEKKVLVTP